LNKKTLTDFFLGCGAPYETADWVLFGAPFDSTASNRPGARFAPKAVRIESNGIETYSPRQNRDMEETNIFDGGDLELCIGDASVALWQIEDAVKNILNDSKRFAMIGGEHLVTLAAVRALQGLHPGLRVLHFDAHADLRDKYLGAKLSHATVMRRVWEILGDGSIWQFGIRSGEKSEFVWASEHTSMQIFNLDGLQKTAASFKDKPVYLTLDLDVLDPSVMPGTGTPEAGGIFFNELLDALQSMPKMNIVGFDMVELSPPCDTSGASTAAACKLLREMLLMFA